MKPIIFNTEMVRAVLDGRKTVTRRVVKLKYSNTHLEMFTNKYGTRLIEKQNEESGVTTIKNPDGTTMHTLLACIEKEPPYRPGDILYVRETWSFEPCSGTCENACDTDAPDFYKGHEGCFVYRSDYGKTDDGSFPPSLFKWHSSIHMPKEAARLFLRVTDVRVERLQDITPDEIWDREGIPLGRCIVPYDGFSKFWDSTIKPKDRALYGWDANPYVWVIEFERVSREEAKNDSTGSD